MLELKANEKNEITKEEFLGSLIPVMISGDNFGLLPKDTPHIDYDEDIKIIFRMKVRSEEFGIGTGVISKELMQKMGTSLIELFERSTKNVEDTFAITEMGDMLAMLGDQPFYDEGEEKVGILYVITNRDHMYGASAVLFPSVMRAIEKTVGGDFYLIQSSVHECLALKAGQMDPRRLMQIIRQVNRQVVAPWEVLTDALCIWHSKTGSLEVVDEKVFA